MGYSTPLYNILESLQYGAIYMLAAFIGGVGLDYLFPVYEPKKNIWTVTREVTAQCLLLILLVYFIRTYVKSIPILFPTQFAPRNYRPYATSEFNGEMMMGFVFLGCQLNLINKIDLIADTIYEWYFKEERTALTKVEAGIEKAEDGKMKIMDKLKQGVVKH
jgi:hypothetical protein